MSNIVLAQPLVAPRCGAINVRPATTADLPFIDSLQKMHTHMVGWMPWKQLEKRIADGHVLIAEAASGGTGVSPVLRPGTGETPVLPVPLGYCLSTDQYMKRDDVGIIYQLNVLPLKQRGLIGATLIKEVFARAAYGCKLFCCWCAQDIQANWFWESIGFVPLAFRTGSRAKQRIHIFWQRRVRDNDDSTPYWFPSQTSGGAVGEDRIVLPIPPGTHWRDAKPLILPGLPAPPAVDQKPELPKTLPGGALVKPRPEQPKQTVAQRMAIVRSKSKHLQGTPKGKSAVLSAGGVKYVDRGDYIAEPEPAKPKRPPAKPRQKNDPKYVAAARELRDRYLEQVNIDRMLPAANGKYDVSRQLTAAPPVQALPLLDAA